MTVKVLEGDFGRKRYAPSVTINSKIKRLTINKSGMALLKSEFNVTNFLQILFDDERTDVFWVRLCVSTDVGAKRLAPASPNTKSVAVQGLLAKLKWDVNYTVRAPMVWDNEVRAARINLKL
jgi:hypothetical protein